MEALAEKAAPQQIVMEWEGEGTVSWSGHQILRVEVSAVETVVLGITKSLSAVGHPSYSRRCAR